MGACACALLFSERGPGRREDAAWAQQQGARAETRQVGDACAASWDPDISALETPLAVHLVGCSATLVQNLQARPGPAGRLARSSAPSALHSLAP
jgi:hypothetical protein